MIKDYTDIIIAPVITEKSAMNAENNVFTFKVAKNATKKEATDKNTSDKIINTPICGVIP